MRYYAMNPSIFTQDFLLSIIGGAPYGIITLNRNGAVTMINQMAISRLGIDEDIARVTGSDFRNYLSSLFELKDFVQKFIDGHLKEFDIELMQFEDKFYNIKGRQIVTGMIVTLEDVTRLKEMEAGLLNSVLEGQELERRRLAKEIHDGLGPLISTIKLNFENIESELPELSHQLHTRIQGTIQLIDTIAQEMRAISHQLTPKALLDFGLSTGLESLCTRINESNKLNVLFISSLGDERFSEAIELGLYRISQELINNVLKHSKAARLAVQLIKHPGSLMLMVEDDGAGFDLKKAKFRGIGLTNIETRATALGGSFLIDSVENGGTTATVEIPLT